jgi:hemolysin type calcium-binding protein
VICGGDGNDYLYGSNGGLALDFLSGDAGDDMIDGGSKLGGIVVYSEAPGAVNVDLSALSATGWGTDRLILISGVLGSNFADTINGGARTDVLGSRWPRPISRGRPTDAGSRTPSTAVFTR